MAKTCEICNIYYDSKYPLYTVESSDEEGEATEEADEENAEAKGDEADAEPGTSGAAGGPPKEKSE